MDQYSLAKKRKKEIMIKYGCRNLSRILKITPGAVSKWEVIPPFRAFQIAQLGDFDPTYIRPDIDFNVDFT